MTVQDNERRIGALEARLTNAVSAELCAERNGRIMDAVDRTHNAIARVEREISNKRRRDLAMMVSIILILISSLLGLVLAARGA